MPEERVKLEEGLADSPQVRAHVAKLEKDLGPYKEFTSLLRDTFQACSMHQEKVCQGTETLSKLLVSYQEEATGDADKLISNSFFRISRYLNELHSCQEMLSTQLQNAVIELLSQFISSDFGKLEKLKESQENASLEHEQAMIKYSRTSKKKDSEKARFENNSELFASRRKFYDATLDYHSELNCFHHKKKFALLEPLLTFMHAQMAYFKVGHEILNKELGKLLMNLNTEVQRVHGDYQKEVVLSAEAQAELRLKFPVMCIPDPDPADPFAEQPVLPSTTLTTKAGYLFIRTQTGFPSKWDRAYFFTKKGCLHIHMAPKPPELVVHLKGAEAASAEMDDRRYVFVVSHSSLKRPLYLLAESENQKEEWICTINNIGQDKGNAQPRSSTKRDEAVIKIEREKIRSWVNKEIDPKKPSPLSKLNKPSPSPTPATTSALAITSSQTTSSFSTQLPSLPSFSSILNFLDPSDRQQSEDGPPSGSSTSSQRKSPIFSRKTSTTPKTADSASSRENGGSGGGGSGKNGSVVIHTHPASLTSPLQPEQLTVGASPSRLPQNTFSKTFFVKYLGHVEVQEGRNVTVILETIQRVVTARAMKNKREAQSIEMTVTSKSINLFDHHAKKAIGQIFLRDILRCAVQPDSSKLFGIVNRVSGETSDVNKPKFLCHVMEAETTGSKVCSAINEAINAAVRIIQTNYSKAPRSKSTHEPPSFQRSKPPANSSGVWYSSSSQSVAVAPPRPVRPPMPKQKSISDSNLGLQASNSRQGSSRNSPARSSDLRNGISESAVDAEQRLPPSSSSASFVPSLSGMQTRTSEQPKNTPYFGRIDLLSSNETSQLPPPLDLSGASNGGSVMPKPNSILTSAAAPDSGYFQMPNSLQKVSEEFTDLVSPLTPLDSDVGSFSSVDSSMLDFSRKNSDPKPAPSSSLPSSSNTSDYVSATDSTWPGVGSDVSDGPSVVLGAGDLEQANPFSSSSSYLPSGMSYSIGETDGTKPLETNDDDLFDSSIFASADTTSSMFSTSSSQLHTSLPLSLQPAGQDNQMLFSQAGTSTSDYVPSQSSFSMQPPVESAASKGQIWDTNGFSEVSFSSGSFVASGNPEGNPFSTTTTNGSTQVHFPMSFADGNDGGEFDEFDLPPLPDSVEVPSSVGGSGQGGFTGSIVTLGTSTSTS